MTRKIDARKLIALADPIGKRQGFLVPVFLRGRSNALYVEVAGNDGLVEAFVDLQPQDVPIIEIVGGESRVGEPAHWAFGFSDGDIIIGRGDKGREELAKRLTERFFMERPLLGLEVAEFLQDQRHRLIFASRALAQLEEVTPKGAYRWRDLSILTPDIRKAVDVQFRTETMLPPKNWQRIAARVDDRNVYISGLDVEFENYHRPLFDRLIYKILHDLSSLYGSSDKRWVIRYGDVVKPSVSIAKGYDLSRMRALVYIADEDADVLRREFSNVEKSHIGIFAPHQVDEFLRQSSEFRGPSFIQFILDERTSQVLPDRSAPRLRRRIGLAARTSSGAGLAPVERRGLDRYPHPTVIVSKREFGAWSPRSGFSGEMRDAIELVSLLLAKQRISLERLNFFVSARGVDPKRERDAWAQIYGRCCRLGIYRPGGIRFEMQARGSSDRSDVSSLVDVLFPEMDLVQPIEKSSVSSKVDAAVLVKPTDFDAPDRREYGEAVARLLKSQKWNVSSNRDGGSGVSRLFLNKHFELFVPDERPTRRERYSLNELPGREKLEGVRRIVATEEAGASSVLIALVRRGEFLATVRDLAFFPRGSSIWSLFASQCRRFASSLPSRPRSYYFAMLCEAAHDPLGRLKNEIAYLMKVIRDDSFGNTSHIICSRVVVDDGRSMAFLRLVNSASLQSAYRQSDVMRDHRFVLTLSNKRPAIEVL